MIKRLKIETFIILTVPIDFTNDEIIESARRHIRSNIYTIPLMYTDITTYDSPEE